ncbi:MAG: HAMP domain-containing histidine kinase [Leptolyngbyaceae cyanobacterium SM1_4_3]|nr:HAMP domain-containing histidine kinase [Leptolyngbyaceae cyanobacterium SM1_4_3]NJN89031.1 HAMP domain-containing histidine kinase [Leptolyngbyaceae cyanobacterium SL_5_14]
MNPITSQLPTSPVTIDEVLITPQLWCRNPRSPDLQSENIALHSLVRQMNEAPEVMMQSLVTIAVDLCQAGSAGISQLELTNCGEEVFHWVALAGAYSQQHRFVPRNFSLCGTCLERGSPQLFYYPERYFTNFGQLRPAIVEALVIPLLVNDQPLGTIWIVSHDEKRRFNAEDLRVMKSLADFTAAALSQSQARYAAEAAAQREQLARMEAEQANLAKDEFLAVVSHEMRTPLTNMKMALLMLQTAVRPERRERYMQILQSECEREIGLVNNLLDLQRLTIGSDPIAWSVIQVPEWLSLIVEPAMEQAQSQQQFFHLDLALASESAGLVTDATKLERILRELLHNACKYTPTGGKIILTVRRNSASTEIRVVNTSNEISPEALERLFEKFYRVPGGDPRKQGGTGLGLTLVQKLVQLLGGQIRVENHANQTTFTVELPNQPEN